LEKLSVLIVDDNAIRASIIEAGLAQDGGTKVTLATGLHGLVERIETVQPDVIVVDIEHPSRDLLESYFTISRAVRKPIAMFVDKSDPGWIEQAIDAGVSSYVVDGLRKNRVKPIIDAAIRRFEAFRRMEMELEQTRSELQGRKHLDRAKSLLMRSKGLSEEDAYALLRRTAMNQNRKIGDVAERLLSAAELLSPVEDDGAAK
jgi:response regulator NasT